MFCAVSFHKVSKGTKWVLCVVQRETKGSMPVVGVK